jgi:hypothetical protein
MIVLDHVFAEAALGIALITHVNHVERFRLQVHRIIHMAAQQQVEQYMGYRQFGAVVVLIEITMDIWCHHQSSVHVIQNKQIVAAVIPLVVATVAAAVVVEPATVTDVIQEQAEHILT